MVGDSHQPLVAQQLHQQSCHPEVDIITRIIVASQYNAASGVTLYIKYAYETGNSIETEMNIALHHSCGGVTTTCTKVDAN